MNEEAEDEVIASFVLAQRKLEEIESMNKQLREEHTKTTEAVRECKHELTLKTRLLQEATQEVLKLDGELDELRIMEAAMQKKIEFERDQVGRLDKANVDLKAKLSTTVAKFEAEVRGLIERSERQANLLDSRLASKVPTRTRNSVDGTTDLFPKDNFLIDVSELNSP